MSTKAIESVLKWVLQGDAHSDASDAMRELEAIHKACRDYDAGTECGEVMTSGAANAADLFEAIAKESK